MRKDLSKLMFFLSIFATESVQSTLNTLIANYLHENDVKFAYFINCRKLDMKFFYGTSFQQNIGISFMSCEKLAQMYKKNIRDLAIIVNTSCHQKCDYLQQNSDSVHNFGTTLLLLLTNVVNYTLNVEQYEKISLGFNVFVLYCSDQDIICENHSVRTKKLPPYNESKHLHNSVIKFASIVNRKQFSGKFKTYITNRRDRHHDTINKLHFSLFRLLQEVHNFSYNVTVLKADEEFDPAQDSKVLGMLNFGKVDVCVGGGLQMISEVQKVDYLTTTYWLKTSFFFRNPLKNDSSSTRMFLKPFSPRVWYIVLITIVVFSLVLKISFWVINDESDESSWSTIVFQVAAVFYQQDLGMISTSWSARFIYINLLVMAFILYNYYSSVWVAMLLNSSPSSYKTIEDLAESSLNLAIENRSYLRAWLANSNSNDIENLSKHKLRPEKDSFRYTFEEGLCKVQSEDVAYYTDFPKAYSVIGSKFEQEAICELVEMSMIPPYPVSFLLRKNSRYTELFQISLRRLHQSGMLNKFVRMWIPDKPECYSNLKEFSVDFRQISEILLYYICGIILALAVLGIEIYQARI